MTENLTPDEKLELIHEWSRRVCDTLDEANARLQTIYELTYPDLKPSPTE